MEHGPCDAQLMDWATEEKNCNCEFRLVDSRHGSTGDDGVIYGEAAGKLIFIEYVLGQQDLVNGVSWSDAIPLGGIPIPPIDNVHILHFGTNESTSGRNTVHM